MYKYASGTEEYGVPKAKEKRYSLCVLFYFIWDDYVNFYVFNIIMRQLSGHFGEIIRL